MAKTIVKPKPILFKPTLELSQILDGMIDNFAVKNRTDALAQAMKEWKELRANTNVKK
jgi:hypothetical protein